MELIERLGGGGSGVAVVVSGDWSASSGTGETGTSYSGGTGGGGSCSKTTSSSSDDSAGNGEQSGKAGGRGNSSSKTATASNYAAGGGAGNPGGYNEFGKHTQNNRAPNGTGGLLVIYTDKLDSTGEITSNGSDGGYVTSSGSYASGGASGGGSINIFYQSLVHLGKCNAKGGLGKEGAAKNNVGYSGNGGNGGVMVGDISSGTFIERHYESDSLLNAIKEYDFTTGEYPVTVKGTDIEKGTAIEEKYNLNVYSYDHDLVLSKNTTYGTKDDVGNATNDATNMIVLKVKGNLTINEDVLLTSYSSKDGYGGPKGMLIYCTGTLTNKGEISMTKKGARAEGQNVWLWKNADGKYEYVPAVGGTGGSYASVSSGKGVASGKEGKDGDKRQTRWWRFRSSSISWWFVSCKIRSRRKWNIIFRWDWRRRFLFKNRKKLYRYCKRWRQ